MKKKYVSVEEEAPLDSEFIGEEDNKPIKITEDNLNEYANEIQFETLSQECVLEDLCKEHNISIDDMFIIIHELKRRGNNIITLNTLAYKDTDEITDDDKVEVTLIRNFGHEKLIDELSYKIVDDDKDIKIMLISDTRFGSKYQQLTILNDMYIKAKNLGVKYVFLNGDVVEGIYSGIKSIYNTTLYKYGSDAQAKLVIDMFPRVDGITTYFITGEHDLSYLRGKEKIDIGKLISKERDDMIYLGPQRKKVDFLSNELNGEISSYFYHAKGNVPYTVSYKLQQQISSFRNEDKPHILVTSHFGACDSFLRRGVRAFQVPTVTATTAEMKDAHTPVYNTIGAWIINLSKDKKGNLSSTRQLWIPYYKTIENDYKTAKALYLTDEKKIYIPKNYIRDDKDRLFSQIRNGEKVDEVSSSLGISSLELGGLIEQLLLKGYDISIKEKDGKMFIYKKKNKTSTKSIKPEIDDLTRVRQVWISDTHLCNEKQQLHLINEVYEEAKNRNIDTVIHFGDITDGDYLNRPEHRYELFRLGAAKQLDYVVNYYPYVEGITTYFITGNHDATHNKNGGIDIGRMIEKCRPDMKFMGSEYAILRPKESSKTTIQGYHPGGGCASGLSYRDQKYIDKMEPGTKPNVLVTGHVHQSHFMSYRNVLAILVPCLTAKTPFATRQGLENTMGAYFVDMYVNKNGEVEMFAFEEKRFTEKDIKKDDYLKTKQLVLRK